MIDPQREQDCLRRLLARQVDGLFVRPVYRSDPAAPVYEEVARQGTPVVILGHHTPFTAAWSNVEIDDVEAAGLAVRHLVELGHRRINPPIWRPGQCSPCHAWA